MTYCREFPISDELADSLNALGEAIDAWGRQIDDAQAAHRADCIKRYGPDDEFDWGILALADPAEKWGASWDDFDCPVGEGEAK